MIGTGKSFPERSVHSLDLYETLDVVTRSRLEEWNLEYIVS